MSRTPYIVGNWKLHKTISESVGLAVELKNRIAAIRDVDVGIAPVATSLAAVAKRAEDSNLGVGGQNCHWENSGAWTGEVGPELLKDAGASFVILGHSERRHHFGESDETVGRKLQAALKADLSVILCVGETESERDQNKTLEVVDRQLNAGLRELCKEITVAYEPVWAIGTGRTATPAQAQEVHAHIRKHLCSRFGELGNGTRLQYGGSVKPGNAAELLRQSDVDGALVGGASLVAEDFVAIVKAARS